MAKEIRVGDRFTYKCAQGVEFERIQDDSNPEFECERMRVKAIHPKQDQYVEYIFGAEPEWWNQRGLVAYPQPLEQLQLM